ncbi:unnamed protein product [Bathycoccus prasinos]
MIAFILGWLSLFVFLGAGLGMNMYILVCLTDLQNDFMNPHDTANRINKIGETGSFVPLSGGYYHVCDETIWILYSKKEIYVDVTEIFNVLDREKKIRGWKVVFFSVVFIITTYRLVEEVVHTMMTDSGRKIAAQVLRDAASSNLYHL